MLSFMRADYMAVQPDPVGAYAAPVMKHMNDDHGDSTVAMVKHYIGIDVSIDSLFFFIMVPRLI